MGFSEAENDTYVANFAATHKDSADTVTADTLGCTGANLLTLATNSTLSFTSTPDFKNPLVCASGDANAYEFTVTATSGAVDRGTRDLSPSPICLRSIATWRTRTVRNKAKPPNCRT